VGCGSHRSVGIAGSFGVAVGVAGSAGVRVDGLGVAPLVRLVDPLNLLGLTRVVGAVHDTLAIRRIQITWMTGMCPSHSILLIADAA
jgi:plasmid replication initiation protein